MLPLKLKHLIGIIVTIFQGVFSLDVTKFNSKPSANSSTYLVNSTYLQTTLPTLVLEVITTQKNGILFAAKSNNTPTTNLYSEALTITEKNTNVIFVANVTDITPKISNLPKSMENNLNESIIVLTLNSTFENFTSDLINDTFKSNSTRKAKLIEFSDSFWILKPVDAAAIVAGVFLVLGVAGYGGCVIYRRYLQRKYGDSEMLSHEEFYDTTDLRYFEI